MKAINPLLWLSIFMILFSVPGYCKEEEAFSTEGLRSYSFQTLEHHLLREMGRVPSRPGIFWYKRSTPTSWHCVSTYASTACIHIPLIFTAWGISSKLWHKTIPAQLYTCDFKTQKIQMAYIKSSMFLGAGPPYEALFKQWNICRQRTAILYKYVVLENAKL